MGRCSSPGTVARNSMKPAAQSGQQGRRSRTGSAGAEVDDETVPAEPEELPRDTVAERVAAAGDRPRRAARAAPLRCRQAPHPNQGRAARNRWCGEMPIAVRARSAPGCRRLARPGAAARQAGDCSPDHKPDRQAQEQQPEHARDRDVMQDAEEDEGVGEDEPGDDGDRRGGRDDDAEPLQETRGDRSRAASKGRG